MYAVIMSRPARKQLNKIEPQTRERLQRAIDALCDDPRPPGVKKLIDQEVWRVRVGDYRVLYEIEDDKLIVVVIAATHRSESY